MYKDFSVVDDSDKNEDILLIYQIISKEYINYFHYKNIEKILSYLNQEYYTDSISKYEGYGKFIYEDCSYYIGKFKNSLRHGKGIQYYKKKTIAHFDHFNDNNELEGSRIIDYQTFDYYIGEWKEDLYNGKGKLYHKVKANFIGDWIDNQFLQGIGKFVDENGDYYIGEWKNGLKNGKGVIYYKN